MRIACRAIGLAALLIAVLASCGDVEGTLPLQVERIDPADANGAFRIVGSNFFQYENGAGMLVQACGVTLPAQIVDPASAELLLPPAGLIRVQVGEELHVTLPSGDLPTGATDVRVIRPDGRTLLLAAALVCAVDDGTPDEEPDPDPVVETVAVLSAEPTTGEAPLVVDFDAAGSLGEGDLVFAWDFGEGGNADVPDPQYTFTAPGTYLVTLTVTSASGTDSRTQTITVTAPPVVGPTARIEIRVDHPSSSSGTPTLHVDASGSSDPDGQRLTYAWDLRDARGGRRTDTIEVISGGHPYGSPLYAELVVTNEDGLSDTARLAQLHDQPETVWNDALHPDQPDISTVQWYAEAGRAHIVVDYAKAPVHLEPGEGLTCDADGVAPGTHVGFIAIDIDRDPTTGTRVGDGHDGMEYLISLSQRAVDGRYPLVAAGSTYDPCTGGAPGVLGWVDVSSEGTTVTFSFDELEGRGDGFDVVAFEYAHMSIGSDTVAIIWR